MDDDAKVCAIKTAAEPSWRNDNDTARQQRRLPIRYDVGVRPAADQEGPDNIECLVGLQQCFIFELGCDVRVESR